MVYTQKSGLCPAARILGAMVLSCAAASAASAQWTVVYLHPTGAPASQAFGAGGNQQMGMTIVGPAWHATMWSGSAASWVDLHPAGPDWSEGWGAGGGQQVGRARVPITVWPWSVWHASLWTGTAASWVDLAPIGATDSLAHAVGDGQQVGWTNLGSGLIASLWSGTAASWVDLTPPGAVQSVALGVKAGQQVGWASFAAGSPGHAGIWSGTPGSFVDLHPAIAAFGSIARDLDAGQQVGDIADAQYTGRASLWTGSAGSWVDLSPVGTWDSVAYAVHAGQQAGYATTTGPSGGPVHHAYVWSGTAASAENLHAFLPSDFINSEARDIWHVGGVTYVAGFGKNYTLNRNEALLWTLPAPCPADYNGDGFVDGIDYDLFNIDFESYDPLQQIHADFNGDGFVDGIDYDQFNYHFETGC